MTSVRPATWEDAGTRVASERLRELAAAGVHHGFAIRQPSVDVDAERAEALARLAPLHRDWLRELGLADRHFRTAEQVHGAEVAVVEGAGEVVLGADALVTADPKVCLGIYVADCCAVYLVDRKHPVIGLAHAGAKGTRLEIVPATLRTMSAAFGTRPEDVLAVLSPCIRPPHYEVDFASSIRAQCRAAGVGEVLDPGQCTGAAPERYYTYRLEKGRTGRMLAVLALAV